MVLSAHLLHLPGATDYFPPPLCDPQRWAPQPACSRALPARASARQVWASAIPSSRSSPGVVPPFFCATPFKSPACARRGRKESPPRLIAFIYACAPMPRTLLRLRLCSPTACSPRLTPSCSAETQKLVKMYAKEGFRQVSHYTKRGIRSAATGFTIASTIVRKFDVAGQQKRKKAMDEREVSRRKLLMAKKGDTFDVYACTNYACLRDDQVLLIVSIVTSA